MFQCQLDSGATCNVLNFIQWCECYARCDWSLPMIYQSADTYRWRHGKVCSTWGAILKMFVRLFRIKASESLEKRWAGAIYKEEKWRNGDKKSSWVLKNPQNYKKSSQQLPSCVIAARDSLFCKMFSPLFCVLSKKRSWKLNFSKKLYTSKIKKKRRSRDEK